tara:strand:+ start:759 stop:1031 length:273 start_codon:yes stop_codon:yes gene_type:complete
MGTKLKKPSIGDVFFHTTANDWYEEARVVSVQSYKDVWKALLLTTSEGHVFLGTGNEVRDKYDWAPKVEKSSTTPPSKRKRMQAVANGSA